MMPWYILVIYGVGITSASVVTFRGLMKPTGTWCWVGVDWPVDRMAFFYAPLWLLFIANVFIVAWIIRAFGVAVKNIPKEWDNRASIVRHYRWVTFHTSMFVLVGMLIWLPGTIYRIWQIVEEAPPYWLIFLQKVLTPSQGILNFLLYVTPMWSKALADARKESLLNEQLQLAEIKKDTIRVNKPSRIQTSLLPISESDVLAPNDGSSDEAPIYRKLGSQENKLKRSFSLPNSVGGTLGNARSSSTSYLRRSCTEVHIEPPRFRERIFDRLRTSYIFHNYSVVEVDNRLVPIWEVQKALRKGPNTEV